jgi:hypothetical protein
MDENYLNQALLPPIEDLALIETHIRLVSSEHNWYEVGILVDEGIKSILILMLQENQIVSILRMCLSTEDSVTVINQLAKGNGRIIYGSYQGENFTRKDIHSIPEINKIWNRIDEQKTTLDLNEIRNLFQRIEKDSKETGRGKDISSKTKQKVMHASHGRCMFTGCGQNLGFDELTGTEGNFSYLAHNIASSELAARGVPVLSEALSNDPENILLLCDKHHRLVDKVAAVDYPAHRLSEMRRTFCSTADKLLEALGYDAIPCFSVLWPVHRQTISAPTKLQIAQSLAPIQCRIDSQLNDISDNEVILRDVDSEFSNSIIIRNIKSTASKILGQTHASRYTAGLFAFGLMPPLIALGALLGNKISITPMLMYRDSGQWLWPLENPVGEFYDILGLDDLSDNEEEISLSLVLTAEPERLIQKRVELTNEKKVGQVVVKALPEYLGNGALGHPEDGYNFTSAMQKLLHQLSDNFGVKRIHLLPCASNAACVFFGQAFDSHHPEIIGYDFADQGMKPYLLIQNDDNCCCVREADSICKCTG